MQNFVNCVTHHNRGSCTDRCIPEDVVMPRTSINLSADEKALFTSSMKRDGISGLTTWMKSICTRYARGELVPPATPTRRQIPYGGSVPNIEDLAEAYLEQSERMAKLESIVERMNRAGQ